MPSRLNDQNHGVFMVIMQRVHERDLSGHILATELGWTHLCLPAVCESKHPFPIRTSVIRKSTGKVWSDPREEGEPLLAIEKRRRPDALAYCPWRVRHHQLGFSSFPTPHTRGAKKWPAQPPASGSNTYPTPILGNRSKKSKHERIIERIKAKWTADVDLIAAILAELQAKLADEDLEVRFQDIGPSGDAIVQKRARTTIRL